MLFMDKNLLFGAGGCFVGTILALFLIKYNPKPILLVILPMWGLVLGASISRTVPEKKK